MDWFINKNTNFITSFITFLIVHKKCTIQLSEKNYPVEKGNILLTREGIPCLIQEKEKITVLCFEKKFFDTIFYSQISDCRILYEFFLIEEPHNEILFFDYDANSFSYSDALNLKQTMKEEKEFQDKLIRMYCVALLTHLQQQHHEHLVINYSSMNETHFFGKILKYMGEHYSDITMKQLAEKFSYHPDYLSHLFKKITGQTFKEKLTEIRMEQACRYLENTDMKISYISQMIGYKDKSHFIKCFEAAYHKKPSQYRKEHQSNGS